MSKPLSRAELLRLSPRFAAARNARRQRQVAHLYECGQRPVFECLLAVENGQPLDCALDDFTRLAPEIYRAVGADTLPIDRPLAVINGGRDDE